MRSSSSSSSREIERSACDYDMAFPTVTELDAVDTEPLGGLCPRCALSAIDCVLEQTSVSVASDRRPHGLRGSVVRWHCPVCFYVVLHTPSPPLTVAPTKELA